MRRATRNGVIAVAAASGALAVALPASAAFAAGGSDAHGSAAGSPGLVSGNGIQLPVHAPVNVCGNTVDVVGLLNPAAGNVCANTGGGQSGDTGNNGGTGEDGASAASGGASAHGDAEDSPGVLSGNGIQIPVDVPVNVSGNSVDVVGIGNPAHGNQSVNGPGDEPTRPPRTPAPTPRAPKPPAPVRSHPAPHPATSTLAHTGADVTTPAVASSAALLLTGAILYRRFRPGRSH
ncbi:chaplin [Streptomyces sp. NPDC052721]|uniref:chaplin n=1 Tax=Streptomyces sp. NPDC052721 TaxID=3154955 RepID=UPI0034308F68